MIDLVLFVIALTLFVKWYRDAVEEGYGSLAKVPGPKPLPIIGNSLALRKSTRVVPQMMEYMKTYGGFFKLTVRPFHPTVILADLESISSLYGHTKEIQKAASYKYLGSWLGDGLITASGPTWRTHRKIITKTFHFEILEDFVEVFNRNGAILERKLEKELENTSFNIHNYISLCALDIICESAMGIPINAQQDKDNKYFRCVREICRIAIERGFSTLKRSDLLFSFTKDFKLQKDCLAYLQNHTDMVIQMKRKEMAAKKNGIDQNGNMVQEKKKRMAFLDMLMHETEHGFTDKELRDEVDTFVFAGHDTTATATSYTLYCLANNPDSQKKVCEELDRIFQGDKSREPTFKDLEEMKYMEMVIKETLRLYPVIPFVARELINDMNYNGNIIKKGSTVVVLIYAIHRNPELYPEPEKFLPERFDPTQKKVSPYAFVPFSAGPRNCIGQKYGMLEIKAIVSRLLRRYEIIPALPEHKVQWASEIVLKPLNGINVRLKERS